MKSERKKHGGLFLILFFILLAIVVGAIFYYLQIKRNEESQNQLHFRALSQISIDIDNTFAQIRSLAVQFSKQYRTEIIKQHEELISAAWQQSTYHPNQQNGAEYIPSASSMLGKERWAETCEEIKNNEQFLNEILDKNYKSELFEKAKFELNPSFIYTCGSEQEMKEEISATVSITANSSGKNTNTEYILQAETAFLKVSIPINSIIQLKSDWSFFPKVIFADKFGRVLINAENNNYHNKVVFNNISELLSNQLENGTLNKQQASPEAIANNDKAGQLLSSEINLGISTMIEQSIGGTLYRMYVSPHKLKVPTNIEYASSSINKQDAFYIIGLRPSSDVAIGRLYISPSLAVILIVSFLILVSLVPIIKIRFVSHDYAFSKGDIWFASVGLIIFVGVATISMADYVLYKQVKRQFNSEAYYNFHNLQAAFDREVKEIVATMQRYSKVQLEKEEAGTNLARCGAAEYASFPTNELLNKQSETLSLVELAFFINRQGQTCQAPWYWSAASQLKNARPKLAFRQYFKDAVSCNGFNLSPQEGEDKQTVNAVDNRHTNTCKNKVSIERIFNVGDGRLTSQFAIPMLKTATDIKAAELSRSVIISAGTVLQSLRDTILPRNFSFTIFEGQSGTVLYHTETKMSLVENFYVSTNNAAEIQSAVWTKSNHPISLSSMYRGVSHQMVIGKLHNEMPWMLAIMYKKQDIRLYNLLLIMSAISLFLMVIFLLIVAVRATISILPWGSVLLYLRNNQHELSRINHRLILLICIQILVTFFVDNLLLRLFIWLAGLFIYLWMAGSLLVKGKRLRHVGMYGFAVVSLTALIVERSVTSSTTVLISTILAIVLSLTVLVGLQPENQKRGASTREVLKHSYFNIYTRYVGLVLIISSAVPAFYLTHSAFGFYIKNAALIESIRLTQDIGTTLARRNNYYSALGVTKSDAQKILMYSSYFCRAKGDEKANYKLHTPPLWDVTFAKGSVNFCEKYRQDADDGKYQVGWVVQLPLLWQTAQNDNHNEVSLEDSYTKNYPVYSMLLKAIRVDLPIPALLNVLLQQPHLNQTLNIKVTSYPALIFLEAVFSNLLLIVIVGLLVLVFLWYVIRRIFVSRFMGQEVLEHVLPNFDDAIHFNQLKKESAKQLLILRPQRAHIDWLLAHNKHHLVFPYPLDLQSELRNKQVISGSEIKQGSLVLTEPVDMTIDYTLNNAEPQVEHSEEDVLLRLKTHILNQLALITAGGKSKNEKVLIMKNLGAIAFDAQFRVKALEFIEFALKQENLRVIILADVSPLFRLTHQDAYPNNAQSEFASASEVMRWSNLFTRFTKFYDWYPAHPETEEFPVNLYSVIKRECISWPELKRYEREFIHFHLCFKLSATERNAYFSDYVDKEEMCFADIEQSPSHLAEFKRLLDKYWTIDEVVEFFTEKAGAVYRYRWEICTKDERLLLYQLANQHMANPLNHEALEHLIRRGYIVNRGHWSIGSRGFKNFIYSAERYEEVQEWIELAKNSSWKYIRIPIFMTIFILFAFILYSATEAYETIIGLMTAVLGLIPLLMRNISIIKGSPPP
ncbi:hypothetical protein [Flocculibacter collagenilyticus]|uniref:hypothetical protein n=1 Tax=Flocculibacter collagenilyticus TaxID=2744479 RepID=UPI0018F75916|nr:hypothetical protein [Flocculibacter collagenilyticus]